MYYTVEPFWYEWTPRVVPSDQSMISSGISGWLGLPSQIHYMISATHLPHVASVTLQKPKAAINESWNLVYSKKGSR